MDTFQPPSDASVHKTSLGNCLGTPSPVSHPVACVSPLCPPKLSLEKSSLPPKFGLAVSWCAPAAASVCSATVILACLFESRTVPGPQEEVSIDKLVPGQQRNAPKLLRRSFIPSGYQYLVKTFTCPTNPAKNISWYCNAMSVRLSVLRLQVWFQTLPLIRRSYWTPKPLFAQLQSRNRNTYQTELVWGTRKVATAKVPISVNGRLGWSRPLYGHRNLCPGRWTCAFKSKVDRADLVRAQVVGYDNNSLIY